MSLSLTPSEVYSKLFPPEVLDGGAGDLPERVWGAMMADN